MSCSFVLLLLGGSACVMRILLRVVGGRKIAQIGQTEPFGVTRRRTLVRREARFVQNTRQQKRRNSFFRISSLGFTLNCLI